VETTRPSSRLLLLLVRVGHSRPESAPEPPQEPSAKSVANLQTKCSLSVSIHNGWILQPHLCRQLSI
jgi:hypothetical protein